MSAEKATPEHLNFLEELIEADLKSGRHTTILTRFPPEPNGYLHIGHASSICLNFGLGIKYGGATNLRFDDTNPVTEETEYVEGIINDVRWLGFEPKNILYASDYFEQLYQWAEKLIEKGLAYVDFSTAAEIAQLKGTPTEAGQNSPFRDTPADENLALFRKMRAGEFPDGHCTLRAKIDMASPNMILRDPLLYRIKHAHHHRTGDAWCIYPMYDWAHGQSDSIEHITHSICTMEFVPHRALYDWCIENLGIFPSKQYEFGRRNLNYSITSKRKLRLLIEQKITTGWDDPRMPTIAGMRRRGFTPTSLREFAARQGVSKRDSISEFSLLENCLREDLNRSAPRAFAVLDPLKVVITNFPEGEKTMFFETENNQEDPTAGTRQVVFSKEIWVERDDFAAEAPPKWQRLTPGSFVRLKSCCIVRCDGFTKNEMGEVVEIQCSIVENSWSGRDTSGVKPGTVIHWLSSETARAAEVRIYDRLFTVEDPASEEDFLSTVNPDSLKTIENALVEPLLANAEVGQIFQFTRLGYFICDRDSTAEKRVFNRTVTLRDNFAKKPK